MVIFSELKQDLIANGWDNGKASTFIKMLFLSLSFHTLFLYRMQVRLNRIPFVGRTLARILAYITTVLTSCQISARAHLEGGIRLPHPNGVIIGKDVIIRSGTTIYQHVTIGAKKGEKNARFPIIESNTTIFTGAVIIGDIKIEKNAIIGANAVVTKNIPANKTAVGIPAKVL